VSAVEVSAEDLAAFVDALFRHADQGSWISLRGFRDDVDNEPPVVIKAVPMNGDLGKVTAAAVSAARYCATYQHPAVFCPPVATFGDREKATEAALANGLALSVELDANPERSRKRLEFLLGPTTVVVASGGTWTDPETGEAQPKLHLHWRLSEPTRTPEAHARLKRARAMAAALVGGDATNKPVVHPIRWPGSVHRKREPKLCRIVEIRPDAEIDLQDALGILLDIQPEFRNPGSTGKEPGDGEDRETSELVRALLTGADYHSTLLALAMRYLKRGMPADQVSLTLRGMMEAIPPERRDGDQPGRWQARYADIGRTIRTGQAKLAEQLAATDAWPEPLDVIGAPELVGYPELPAECLPVPLHRYVVAEAERLNVDPCPLAGHVLAACAASISDAWRVRPKRHDRVWTQQARIWSCVIKDVGQRGTEMIRSAFWPVKDRDAKAFEQWQHERAAWAERQVSRKKGDRGDDDPEPTPKRFTTSDATIEAASQILANGDRHAKLTLICDELTGFLGSFGRYSPNGAAARAQWLESFDGGPQRIDRIRRGHVFVPNWSLVIAGNIQPRRLAGMAGDLIDDGLFQRFMTIHAKPAALGVDDDQPLPVDIGRDYHELHRALVELQPAHDAEGKPAPAFFDDDAQSVRRSFRPLIERLQIDPTLPTVIRETAPKWSGLLARLSLVFHLVDLAERHMAGEALNDQDLCRVSGPTVDAATMFLRRVVLPNLFRLGFETMPEEGAPAAHAHWLAGYILAHKSDAVTAREIGRAYRPLRGKPAEIGEAMAVLNDGGWSKLADGRHDGAKWAVNPAVHVRFADAAGVEQSRRRAVFNAIRTAVTDL
jgi:hypothetical protein